MTPERALEMHSTMNWLLAPVPWQNFLAETWEQRPLHIARGDPHYFADVLDVDDLHELLEYGRLVPPRIRIASNGTSVQPEQYVHEDGRLDLHAIRRLYAQGKSVILNGLEAVWPSIGRLVDAMQRELSYRVEANSYLTPRGNRAFKPHYDTHEVLVLQLHGTKQWRLYDAPYPSPLPTSAPEDAVDVSNRALSMAIELTPGDMLYVPRGWIHEAASGPGTSSLHLTLGIHPPTWYDLVSRALEIAALRDAGLRRSLPVGFLRRDANGEDLEPELNRMLNAVPAPAAAAEAVASLHGEFLRRARHPADRKMIRTLDDLDEVADDTKLIRRGGVEARMLHFTDAVAIQFATSVVRGPQRYEAAMRFVLDRANSFSVAELPDIDEEQRTALGRRLLTEGLLAFADASHI